MGETMTKCYQCKKKDAVCWFTETNVPLCHACGVKRNGKKPYDEKKITPKPKLVILDGEN